MIRVSKSAPGDVAPEMSGKSLNWKLGDLKPGATAVVSFTGKTSGSKTVKHVATAQSLCARDGDQAKAVTAMVETEVHTLPALLLELVDQKDPIQVGSNEVYTLVVLNQGEGEDRNVKLVVHLPEGLTFVSADGPTKATVKGQDVTFGTIEKLAGKEKVSWTITAKADKPGDVRTKVDLTSDYLTTPVPETEPTRLIE